MSITVLEIQSLINLENKIFFFQDKLLYQHIREKEIQKNIQILYDMNQECYINRYKDNLTEDEKNIDIIDWSIKEETITEYQLLKTMQCLLYNIETELIQMDTEKEDALEFLDTCIKSTMDFIIDKIPEYKAAKWE